MASMFEQGQRTTVGSRMSGCDPSPFGSGVVGGGFDAIFGTGPEGTLALSIIRFDSAV